MRRILAASLLFAPMLFPAAASARKPATDASASTQLPQRSTGVTDARIIYTPDALVSPEVTQVTPAQRRVVLRLNIDEQGKAVNVQIVKSVNPVIDARVVEAVRQIQWRPATLDHQAVQTAMTLNVEVKR